MLSISIYVWKLACYQKTRRSTVVWRKINVVLITRISNQSRWPVQLDFFLGTGSRDNRFFASQYNNATTPAQYIQRAFPRESHCACACTRIAYSKKHIALTARIPWHFFPRNYQTWRLGKGKVNRLFMCFFFSCDAPMLISFGFFPPQYKIYYFFTYVLTTIIHDTLCMVV